MYMMTPAAFWRNGKAEGLLDHLKSMWPIQLTLEVEKDGMLPFLDTLLRRKENGSLDITVYMKPTHTKHYLDFQSHHPPHVKMGLVRCLFDRVWGIIPTWGGCWGLTAGWGDQSPLVMLPYTAGVSEDIRRVCRKYSMRAIFRSGLSLCSVLTRVKDPLPMEKRSKVMCQIPCSCGKIYICETRRKLETRLREHQEACRKGTLEKSAVAEHAWKD